MSWRGTGGRLVAKVFLRDQISTQLENLSGILVKFQGPTSTPYYVQFNLCLCLLKVPLSTLFSVVPSLSYALSSLVLLLPLSLVSLAVLGYRLVSGGIKVPFCCFGSLVSSGSLGRGLEWDYCPHSSRTGWATLLWLAIPDGCITVLCGMTFTVLLILKKKEKYHLLTPTQQTVRELLFTHIQ